PASSCCPARTATSRPGGSGTRWSTGSRRSSPAAPAQPTSRPPCALAPSVAWTSGCAAAATACLASRSPPVAPLAACPRRAPAGRRGGVRGGRFPAPPPRPPRRSGRPPPAGNVSHTGVGGLTLGGGMGWLARQVALACDNVTRFQVVTAAGELLHANQSEHPDLYWGLRGGGGNFGVVTEFEFRLHPVAQAALLVDLFSSPEDAPRNLRRWRALLPDAPRQATLTAWAGTSGRWPFLPPALHNRPLASVGYVWVGEPD